MAEDLAGFRVTSVGGRERITRPSRTILLVPAESFELMLPAKVAEDLATMRSWNQFSAFVEEWGELRTLAA